MLAVVPSPIVVKVEPDLLTGRATAALAVLTLLTLFTTIVITMSDRKIARRRLATERENADRRLRDQREDADRRLRDEREDADRRLRDERKYVEDMRLRERQQEDLADLISRIAALTPYLDVVPNLYVAPDRAAEDQPSRDAGLRLMHCWAEVVSLRRGADAQAAGLRHRSAAQQYRTLAHLVNSAATGVPEVIRDRVIKDLCHYAIFVRLSLAGVLHDRLLPEYDPSGPPDLFRPANDTKPWESGWAEWKDAVRQQPLSPYFEPSNGLEN
jgi:hypothetical protein